MSINMQWDWDLFFKIGPYFGGFVALFLGVVAIFSRRKERLETIRQRNKNAQGLRFKIASELLHLKEILELYCNKKPKDGIVYLVRLERSFQDRDILIDILNKLELYHGQSVLLSEAEINELETIIHFTKMFANRYKIEKKHLDKLYQTASDLRSKLWTEKILWKARMPEWIKKRFRRSKK